MMETSPDLQILLRMGLVMVLGFLIGVERGWSLQDKKEGERTMGVRTFTLIALAGGLWGLLSGVLGEVLLGFVLLGVIAMIMSGYVLFASRTELIGLTTEFAALITFTLGVVVMKGYIVLAVSVSIAMILILNIKPKLHGLIEKIEPEELTAGIIFLIISAVLLPLLPNRGFGPWQALNPYEIWWMVVLVAGISYSGYIAMKYLGEQRGILFTSFTGALVSSIAVTVSLGRYSRRARSTDLLIFGVLIAIMTVLVRVVILVIIFNSSLLLNLILPITIMFATTVILAFRVWKNMSSNKSRRRFSFENPLQLSTALQFGLLLGVIILLSEASKNWYGDMGIYGLSLLSGMVDIDSITLSLLQMSNDNLPGEVAASGIVFATLTNTLVKGGIFIFFTGIKKGSRLMYLSVIIAAAGLVGLFLF